MAMGLLLVMVTGALLWVMVIMEWHKTEAQKQISRLQQEKAQLSTQLQQLKQKL
jgi:Tfp pilus assembly protein PilN